MTLIEPNETISLGRPMLATKHDRLRSFGRAVLAYAVVLAAAAGLAAILVLASGSSPFDVLHALLKGSIGSGESLSQTANGTVPIVIVATGATVAGRAGFLNVGQEGQVTMGAMAAAAIALRVAGPGPFVMGLALAASGLAGAVWAAPAALLRLKRNVSEVITTLLLTFVSISAVSFAVNRKWLLQGKLPAPQSNVLSKRYRFPKITIAGVHITTAAVLAVVLLVVAGAIFAATRWGASAKLCGANPFTAVAMGVNRVRVSAVAIVSSGALAGLAGGVILTASSFQLQPLVANDVGWNGLLVALVARNRATAVLPIALFFGALRAGGGFVETTGVPRYIIQVLQALLVIACALPPLYLERRRRERV